MAFAPLAGPSGGPMGACGIAVSGFCSSVMNSFRLAVFGVSFEAREIIFVASGDRMPRHEPVHRFAHEAGHRVVAAHAHNRFRRLPGRRFADLFQLPAFRSLDTVTVAESPL